MKQILSCITGLDKMLNGGLPVSRCILVCGGPGSGKTVLSMQFLYYGALQHNEPGLYVSLDEDVSQLKEDVVGFGWDIEQLRKKKMLSIVDASPIRRLPGTVKIGDLSIGKREFNIISLIEIIRKNAEEIGAKRVVIDPLTALVHRYTDISERRTAVLDLFEALTNIGTVNIITDELRRVSLEREIRVEEYQAHGVIVLHVFANGREMVRGIQIEKMRGVAHDMQIRPYKITENGVEVFSQEGPLTGITTTISAPQLQS